MHFGKEKMFRKAKNIPASYWSRKWQAGLNIYDVGPQLAVACGAAGSLLKMSAIPHKDAG